jgi:hypothetical protein
MSLVRQQSDPTTDQPEAASSAEPISTALRGSPGADEVLEVPRNLEETDTEARPGRYGAGLGGHEDPAGESRRVAWRTAWLGEAAERLVVPRLRRLPLEGRRARRAALFLVPIVIAGLVGALAEHHIRPSYSAQALLLVKPGATASGPGSASEANLLATTYAALIPSDDALAAAVANRIGSDPAAARGRIGASVVTGTSLLELTYRAPRAETALVGARAAALAIASGVMVSGVIPAGSVQVVGLPTRATRSGGLARDAGLLGALLGAALGAVLVATAERADPRIDRPSDLEATLGCRAAAVPDDIGLVELDRALAGLVSSSGPPMCLAPMAERALRPSRALALWLAVLGRHVVVPPRSVVEGGGLAAQRATTIVAVVTRGERARLVQRALGKLRLIGLEPKFALLVPARLRMKR